MNKMQNPFLKLTSGLPGNIGKACMSGFAAEIMHYGFFSGTGESCYLGIARKDQFAGDEEAFICITMRFDRFDHGPDNLNYREYIELSTEEDFVEIAEKTMVPVYGTVEIKETGIEKFIDLYDEWIDSLTSYFRFYENEKMRFKYNDNGIYRNGEEYTGNYQLFHPLLEQDIEKCFHILDEWNRKEYFAITARYYVFLNQEFHSL